MLESYENGVHQRGFPRVVAAEYAYMYPVGRWRAVQEGASSRGKGDVLQQGEEAG